MLGRISLYVVLVIAVMSVGILVSHVVYTPTLDTITSSSALLYTQEQPRLSTSTWGIFDPETGDVLVGSDIETQRPIASVTKLFTAYAAVVAGVPDEPVTITLSDVYTEGESGKLQYGSTMTLESLLFPLLLESSNDAGTAIARLLGSRYESSVSELVHELDLRNTSIAEPTGLSPESVSDVTDLARFYSFVRRTHPHVTDITQLRMYIRQDVGLINNNPARSLEGFTGGKHGYIPEAGRTFVGTFTVPQSGKEVGIVLLGSSDLLSDIHAALEYAHTRF